MKLNEKEQISLLAYYRSLGGGDGTVVLTPECYTIFTPDEDGNCRYQIQRDMMWTDQILNKIRDLARWRPSK